MKMIKSQPSLLLCFLFFVAFHLQAQTSWKGTTSTNWNTASNWTAGVPTSTIDAIIGDSFFTGSNQPSVTNTSNCKNLTIGASTKVCTLTIGHNLNVYGNVTIASNGTILANTSSRTITLRGNWVNSGTYSATKTTAKVTFSSTAQSIVGTTAFQSLTINSGCVLTLASNVSVASALSISGTLDPTASYTVSGSGTMSVTSTGTIRVHTATFAGNYTIAGTVTLSGTSTVNYCAAILNQDISSSYTYGVLRVSGGSIKSLSANLPALSSASSSSGKIFVDAGTLDLQAFTANRNTSGGSITLAANTFLKIGGSNGFPANFSTKTIAATSTVEYYGNNQTVIATTYGHLILSGTSGSVTKTMPSTALTIAGNFTCGIGAATSLSATAAQNITVNRDVTIGASCTFAGGSFSHTFKANYINNGFFTGSTSTVTFSGVSSNLSGTGANNFNNVTFSAFGTNANNNTSISVSGNMTTSGSGAFTHTSGGTVLMSGTTKTISGNGFIFSNLVISGSVTTAANIRIVNDLTVNGSFAASAGTVTMSAGSGILGGSASPVFYSLSVTGNISTAINFSLLANLSVTSVASFTASSGTATLNGTSTLSGTANLNNVTINASRTLTLGNSSVLGIAGIFTKTGTLNVTSVTPNTVKYNGPVSQTIVGGSYYNLILANSGTKTPSAAITVNNDFTINSGVTFNASTFIFSLYRHLNNYGTFLCGTSDVQLRGINAATLSGNTTFNTFKVNKSTSAVRVSLAGNITASNIIMTSGNIFTDTNSITTTGGRSGNGIIIGTVIHNHAFTDDTAYAFEGPNNLITFDNPSGITSVSVTSKIGEIADFEPSIECVIREYEIDVPVGTYTRAKLKMHYENNELNAFSEPFLSVYKHNSGFTWDSLGFSIRDTALNYVEQDSMALLAGRYTASGTRNIVRWNGSVSSDWSNAANWTTISGTSMTNRVPTATDAAQLGEGAFTNQPVISSSQQVSVVRFGSAQSATLTVNGGSLSSYGSIRGQWSAMRSHTLEVSSGTLTSGTTLLLSDDTSGHDIHLKIGSGAVNVTSDLIHSATGAVTFTGSGSLTVSGDYQYAGGNFTAGSGTVYYAGGRTQKVAHLPYNNLSFNKSTERASFHLPTTVTGNLTIAMGGEVGIYDSLSIGGNLTIGSSTFVYNEGAVIKVGGNWTNNGNYISNNGIEYFNGSGNQTVSANTFSNVFVDKPSGILSLTGNLVINGDLTVHSGTLDLDSLQASRFTVGGTLAISSGATLKIRTNNFPSNYVTNTLATTSTVNYYGAAAQNVLSSITYGNLVLNNGGTAAKSIGGNIQVNGDLTINSGTTFSPGSNSINLYGNFVNAGTFVPGTSAMVLNGSSKTISGSTTFNDVSVATSSYTVTSGTITMTGNLYVESTGSLDFGTNTAILDGDLTNKGTLVSNGTATFTGSRVQTIQLLNALTSSSTGIVNFNGTVAPVINSTSSPTFATVNINNTSGVTPSVPWTVIVSFNVGSGATFDGGPLMHTFYGNFTNNGTVFSSGKLRFRPGSPFSTSATVTLDGTVFTSTGEVEFAGTAPLTIVQNNPAFNIINITNTHTSGITAPGSWAIADELRIASGSTFKAGNGTSHIISGTMLNNGTLEGQTSTLRFDGASAEINGLGTYNFNNLKVESSGTLTLNRSVNVLKDLIVDGAFYGDGRTVNFSGSSPSFISGSVSSVTLGDLGQSKTSSTTTLSIPVIVTGHLELTSGVLVSSTANMLTIADDATASSGSATSFVSGPMKKIGNEAFEFPLGKNSFWARLGISAPSVATDAFVAEYFNNPYANTTTMAAAPSPVLNDVSVFEYWTCDRANGSSNVKVTLFWETGYSGINDYSSDLVVARWNGSAWENKGQSAISASRPGKVTSDPVTSFSPFTFGSLSSSLNMLPIKLLSFEGQLNAKNEVELNWRTASEINNDYFTIERSVDGVNFEPIATVDGAGNSLNVLWYSAKDLNPFKGISYYKLKQTDFNGHVEHSHIIVLINNELHANEIVAYPNPATSVLHIDLNPGKAGKVVIRNVLGDILFMQQTDQLSMDIDISEFLSGIYILTLETESAVSRILFKKM